MVMIVVPKWFIIGVSVFCISYLVCYLIDLIMTSKQQKQKRKIEKLLLELKHADKIKEA